MNMEKLKPILENCEVQGDKVIVNNNFHEVIKALKDSYHYNMLKSVTAVDLQDCIELIYNLYSTETEESVLISVKVVNETDSITDLFESARADENEIYDMFGVNFIGNDDLKRLYMPESWQGFPLRKDYIQDDTRLAWNDNSDKA